MLKCLPEDKTSIPHLLAGRMSSFPYFFTPQCPPLQAKPKILTQGGISMEEPSGSWVGEAREPEVLSTSQMDCKKKDREETSITEV